MRIIGLALASVAVALVGMLVLGVADSAFAAKKKQDWRDTPIPNLSAQTYRSASQKSSDWRNTPIPNQSAQTYRSSSHKKKSN